MKSQRTQNRERKQKAQQCVHSKVKPVVVRHVLAQNYMQQPDVYQQRPPKQLSVAQQHSALSSTSKPQVATPFSGGETPDVSGIYNRLPGPPQLVSQYASNQTFAAHQVPVADKAPPPMAATRIPFPAAATPGQQAPLPDNLSSSRHLVSGMGAGLQSETHTDHLRMQVPQIPSLQVSSD